MDGPLYDDPDFFAAYSQLPRSTDGLDGAGEWPRLRALVPPLAGARVLDLGCGFGWFARWAADQGAAEVLGIDVSERMLERARRDTTSPVVRYLRADLDTLTLAPAAHDLVFSSLTLHYLTDLPRLVREVAATLVPGGRLVASLEHPVYTAPRQAGWRDVDGRTVWPLDGYADEGPRTTDWLAPGVVKQHRTMGSIVGALLDAGLVLTALEEWAPSDDDLERHPDWAEYRERPMFLFVAAAKPAGDVSS